MGPFFKWIESLKLSVSKSTNDVFCVCSQQNFAIFFWLIENWVNICDSCEMKAKLENFLTISKWM